LGYKGWHGANKLIEVIEKDKNVNIKSSDNRYHVAVKVGNTSLFHKYSDAAFELLTSVRDGVNYDVVIP
ncbi:MAG TPA: SIR2 family protein, partial [Armatimonadota bacterium]|nr:SIR2 family protein [Armatimonadota bacterium]